MSVDINWEALTGGPDGIALAETIRAFIHERFQTIPFPRLIRSVAVHGFEFGSIPPEIVLKDICDPLPDFYENDEDDSAANDLEEGKDMQAGQPPISRQPKNIDTTNRRLEHDILERSGKYNLARGATPGLLGTTSNLGYFHLPLSAGMPGTHTPLAAVAGAHFPNGSQPLRGLHNQGEWPSSTSPPSIATPASSQGEAFVEGTAPSANGDGLDPLLDFPVPDDPERSPEDLQVVFHVSYAGDVRLSLTAEVFLDYPMPSFVGIPLKLNITGFTFSGVGIVAYIKKRAHLCFLNPEDAEALTGGESTIDDDGGAGSSSEGNRKHGRIGALLEGIKIETEMGGTDSGKQVLKNVGKIEKFILEQVQRIFEDEFVYPSFWTFLL